jgi:hypothetical protein
MTDDSPGADFIDEADRRKALPEHERDDDTSAGGGLMGSGLSATDRGTGDTGGTAQGPGAGDGSDDPGVATPMVAGTPAPSGAQPFAPVYVEETADEGAIPDENEEQR